MKAIAVLLIIAAIACAVPAPPEIIINNATKECSGFSRGDECASCAIPQGWTSLAYGTTECPAGYKEIDAQRNCIPAKNSRCCSAGHSGAPGDCDPMIIDHLAKTCRFLDEDEDVPSGWEAKTAGEGAWQCPADYKWIEDEQESGRICTGGTALSILAAFGFVFALIMKKKGR